MPQEVLAPTKLIWEYEECHLHDEYAIIIIIFVKKSIIRSKSGREGAMSFEQKRPLIYSLNLPFFSF